MDNSKHNYLGSTTFSDLTVRYGPNGSEVFHGHRVVLCNESAWFRNACEGSFREASSREITLVGDDPTATKLMLEFCYNHEYKYEDKCFENFTVEGAAEEIKGVKAVSEFHEAMFQIAQKYVILSLAQYAFLKQRHLANAVDEAALAFHLDMVRAADRCGIPPVSACSELQVIVKESEDISAFNKVVDAIYEKGYRDTKDLKTFLVQYAVDMWSGKVHKTSFTVLGLINLIEKHPDFGVAVLKAMLLSSDKPLSGRGGNRISSFDDDLDLMFAAMSRE